MLLRLRLIHQLKQDKMRRESLRSIRASYVSNDERNITSFAAAFDMTATKYYEYTQANYQTLLNSLAAGKYAMVAIPSTGSTEASLYGPARRLKGSKQIRRFVFHLPTDVCLHLFYMKILNIRWFFLIVADSNHRHKVLRMRQQILSKHLL